MEASNLFSIRSSAFPAGTRLLAFTGKESISRLYQFTLYLLVRHEDDVDLGSVVGSRMAFSGNTEDGAPRSHYNGILASVELVHELPGDSLYRAVMVPALWKLTLTHHCHVYVNQKVPDILEATLKMGGLSPADYELRLAGRYRPIEHVCQYKESYFNFLSRWMEREGIYYFFEQNEGKEKLILTDSRSFHQPSSDDLIRFFPTADREGSTTEALRTFTCQQQALPARVTLDDYNPLTPDTDMASTIPVAGATGGEVRRYGDNTLQPSEARRIAGLRSQEYLAQQTIYRAVGRVFEVRPGFTFELTDHPRARFNTEYLCTAVTHQANLASATPEAQRLIDIETDDVYRVEVTSIPASVQFRPESVTAWPRVDGIEEATVDGEATSEYAQIDEHGRYLVKLQFDESDLLDGLASTRIRMLQPHGGSPEGFHFPLRKGTEVLLVFLGGDPDRPLIVGVGPNTNIPSPVVSANHTLNVIQTGGLNRVEMEDNAGGQYIKMTTPTENTMIHMGAPHNPTHNLEFKTDGNCLLDTGREWDTRIAGYLDERVTQYVKEDYSSTKDTHVVGRVTERYDNTHDRSIGVDQILAVTGTQTETVTGAVHHTYENTFLHDVTGKVTENYSTGHELNVTSAGQTNTITGGQTTTVTSAGQTNTITGGQTNTITSGGVTTNITGDETHTVSGTINVTAADEKRTIAATQTWMKGDHHEITAGYKFEAKASASIEIAVSAKLELAIALLLSIKASIEVSVNLLKIEATGTQLAQKTVKVSSEFTSLTLGCGIKLEQAGLHVEI